MIPSSGNEAAEALPFTLNRRSDEDLSDSNKPTADDLPPTGKYVPLEPMVPRRCESLPTVNRFPAVSAYLLALRFALRGTPPLCNSMASTDAMIDLTNGPPRRPC